MYDLLLDPKKKVKILRIQNPVAFGAQINLPIVFDVSWMDEFHGLINICILRA